MSTIVYLTTAEAASLVRKSPKTLETLRVRGGGPPFRKLGGSVRYIESELIAWANGAGPMTSTAQYKARGLKDAA
jgi:predicted DNA-binding transcriptional regulator AlpA